MRSPSQSTKTPSGTYWAEPNGRPQVTTWQHFVARVSATIMQQISWSVGWWFSLGKCPALAPTMNTRVDRFEEALRIVVPLVRGESVTFDGRYHQARDAVLEPAPARRIPVLVAAVRPRMLRLTARYADAWNTAWFGAPDERLRERLEHLDAALAAEGRDPETLERTVGIEVRDPERVGMADEDGEDRSFSGSVDELAEAIDAYEALGIGHLIVVLQPMTDASLEGLALALSRRR